MKKLILSSSLCLTLLTACGGGGSSEQPAIQSNSNSAPIINNLPTEIEVDELQVDVISVSATDPDGDNLSFLWFQYPEAGTYNGKFELGQPENAHKVHGKAPEVSTKQTIHVILKLSDKGRPSLSSYKRIILEIIPK